MRNTTDIANLKPITPEDFRNIKSHTFTDFYSRYAYRGVVKCQSTKTQTVMFLADGTELARSFRTPTENFYRMHRNAHALIKEIVTGKAEHGMRPTSVWTDESTSWVLKGNK